MIDVRIRSTTIRTELLIILKKTLSQKIIESRNAVMKKTPSKEVDF